MSVTMRDAYGKKLAELGEVNKKIVVLDADVSASSKSGYFAKAFPDRFLNCGVAEGNMAGVAAGLASAGFHPVINTFAIFIALKTVDQLRHDFCYNKLPIVIAGAYGGLSDSFDGASHQAVEDIAVLRALPNMEVIVPGDNKQAELALEYALAQDHPVYLRLTRNDSKDLPSSEGFASKTPIMLRPGAEVTIAATGLCAAMALEAAELLEKDGIRAEVFTVPFVKPILGDNLAESLKKTRKLVTVEEHSIMGGFGSAVLEKAAQSGALFQWQPIGVEDRFGDTGPYGDILAKYGLSAEKIAQKIKNFK
jgi:transketolase